MIIFINACNKESPSSLNGHIPIKVFERGGNIYFVIQSKYKGILITDDSSNYSPIVSPNYKYIAYGKKTPNLQAENQWGTIENVNSIWLYNVDFGTQRLLTHGGYYDGNEIQCKEFANIYFNENKKILFSNDSKYILFMGLGGSGGSMSLLRLDIKTNKIIKLLGSITDYEVTAMDEILVTEKLPYPQGGYYHEIALIDINGNKITWSK